MVLSLFLVQIFATLGYSVLFSTLVLYTTKALGFSSDLAVSIMGSFVAFNFVLHVVGGALTGKLFSHRFLFLLGMILQALGTLTIAVGGSAGFYWGLSIFLTGSGLNVTCINCMLTQLYEPHDKKRERAFLWNYSGMNLGFLIGFTISGFFEEGLHYTPLFLFASASNVLTILVLLVGWKRLADRGTSYLASTKRQKLKLSLLGLVVIVALFFALRLLIGESALSNVLVLVFGVLMWCFIVYSAFREKESQKIWAFFILSLASLVFWTLYMMAPMGLTLFIEHNVKRVFWGYTIPPQWVLNINTLVIILGGPSMAHIYKKLRDRGWRITIPFQFAASLFLVGLGLAVVPIGIFRANPQGYTAFGWIVLSYVLQAVGELFISPIGYAMVGQLVPRRSQGIMMGIWLMVTGIAATLASFFSKWAIGVQPTTNPLATNASFSRTFFVMAAGSAVAGVIMILLKRFLDGLIREEAHFGGTPAEPV